MFAYRLSFAACAVVCFLTGGTALARAADLTYAFNIPEERLADTLIAIGRQTTMNIVFTPETVDDSQSPAIRGTFTVEQALTRALAKTKLQARQATANSILIEPLTTASASSKQRFFPVSDQKAAADPPGDRMARVDQGQVQSTSSVEAQNDQSATEKDEKKKSEQLQVVVVTGTHIRGAESTGSKLITVDRDYIDTSGYANIADVIKTLPQNFGGGVGEGQVGPSRDSTVFNYNLGTAVNLRGLGVDSTLVLVDGQRQPVSDSTGSFVDVSAIPAAAIERVEILTDGASGIYGTDAVGGVVNFILRKNFEGAETSARVGSYTGDATETEFSQLFGKNWSAGNILVGYQYLKRDALPRADRTYTASYDLRPFGGTDYRLDTSNPGNILDPNTGLPAYAIPRGQNGIGLTPSQLLPGVVNYYDGASQGQDLLPEQVTHAVFLNLTQDAGDYVKLFAQGHFSSRHTVNVAGGDRETLTVPSSNPFFVDPFGGQSSINVAYNMIDDLGREGDHGTAKTYFGAFGATVRLFQDWQATLSGAYGEQTSDWTIPNIPDQNALGAALADSNPATAFNPFGDGSYTNPATLALIRSAQVEYAKSFIRSANLTMDGSLLDLPGGTLRAAVGADYRKEDLSSQEFVPDSPVAQQSLGRHVSAEFAELSVPIIGVANRLSGVDHLALSLAGRHEQYSDFGSTTNPKLGLEWMPTSILTARGTWGTSFRAPRLVELAATPINNVDLPLPLPSATGTVNTLLRFGNNASLKEETAHVWTTGLELTPQGSQGPDLSLTYFNINYKNRIVQPGPPGNPFGILFQPTVWASAIVFNPSPAQIAPVCNSGFLVLESVSSCLSSTPQAIVDLRLLNLAEVKMDGMDLNVKYPVHIPAGVLEFGLNATATLRYDTAVTTTAPTTALLGTIGSVPRLRARGSISWAYRQLRTSVMVNYTGNTEDNVDIPNRPVGSWTTADVNVGYRFASAHRALDNLTVSVSAVNVLNHTPPFANIDGLGYDPANANLYGRILGVQLTKAW